MAQNAKGVAKVLLLPLPSRLSQALSQDVGQVLLRPKDAVHPAAAFE